MHLVFRDLTLKQRTRLAYLSQVLPNIDLVFYPISQGLIDQISVEGYHLPLETYFRFLLPDLLSQVERVLYLDIDVLVCGNLSEFYRLDLGQSCLAGVPERDISVFFPEHPPTLGVPVEDYINAGILLLDLEKMRQRDLSRQLIAFAVANAPRLRFGDQDIINIYFKEELVRVDTRYNYTNYLMRYEGRSVDDVAVLHYNGPVKPWFKNLADEERYMSYLIRYKDYQLAYQDLLLTYLLA